jgi:ABC-type branched-subunit amino acid transport system substrate-binding protein
VHAAKIAVLFAYDCGVPFNAGPGWTVGADFIWLAIKFLCEQYLPRLHLLFQRVTMNPFERMRMRALDAITDGGPAGVVVNNPWGLAHLDTIKKAVTATGTTLVKEIIVQNFDNNDLSTELTILKDLNLDAIFVTLNFNDMALFGRKVKELNIGSKIIAHSNFADVISNNKLSKEAGLGVTVFRFSEPSKEFVNKFLFEYGKNPGIYSDTAYDSVYVIKYAIEKYGDSSEEIIKGIKEIRFNGASGEIYFGNKNHPDNKQPILEEIN